MALTRFQLESPTLEGIAERVARDHGPDARIVAVERVTVGGIGGLFARRHFEVTVEAPHAAPGAVLVGEVGGGTAGGDAGETRRSPGRGRRAAVPPLPPRSGILALLAEADDTEARLHGRPGGEVSTGSEAFARVLDGLTLGAGHGSSDHAGTGEGDEPRLGGDAGPGVARPPAHPVSGRPAAPPRARPAVPAPLRGPGDLILVVGVGADAARAASAFFGGPGSGMAAPGPARARTRILESTDPLLADRAGVLRTRAEGVMAGTPICVRLALDPSAGLPDQLSAVAALGADQLWAAVDAGRKSEDTRAWVEPLDALGPVDAVAALDTERTATPQTVLELGIPVLYLDAPPVPSLSDHLPAAELGWPGAGTHA
ncbi:hypothetical protein ACX8Z9_05165 [Arthrobacter halodurans]|uniref:Uncharacterized protein n=1 Tax=Arthrobacter halodurans TaxID=516699 RepID=A0ABV4UNZ3_9MICC